MAVKFFGQFLVERNIVSRELLLKAIELQDSVNLKFGEMALSISMITPAEAERVNEAQKSEDLRFGDMAVKLGILTEEQMKEVLTRQKNSHLYIGEALVKVGALASEELPRYLDEFKTDQAPYVVDHVAIPAGVPHAALWEITADLTYKMFTRIVQLTFRPGQCEIINRIEPNNTIVSMRMSGATDAEYFISVSGGVREMIARAILKEDDVSGEQKDVLDDTVMEFANVVLGNIAAKAAQIGKDVEIHPPEVVDTDGTGIDVPAGSTGLAFPIHVMDERVALCVIVER
ncbi:MAG: chemotaxis protein CheX [Nitrospirae bacterium]|nr:chemotaxis protein CheX [Nitrospirota bacterium]